MKPITLIFALVLALDSCILRADTALFYSGEFETEPRFEEKLSLLATKPRDVDRQSVKGTKTVKWLQGRIGANRSEVMLHFHRSAIYSQPHRLDIFARRKSIWKRINRIKIAQGNAEIADGNPKVIGAYWLDTKARKIPIIALWVPDATFGSQCFVWLMVFSRGLDHSPNIQKFEVYPQSIDDSQTLSIKNVDKCGYLQPQVSHVHLGRPEGGYDQTDFYEWNGRTFTKTHTQ